MADLPDPDRADPDPVDHKPVDASGPLDPLDPVDQRVLGSLLEKEITVPASYPLSLNALRTACNQTSSRDPVTDYDEPMLEQRLREMKARGLVRIVWAGRGARTLKYHQLLDETLRLAPAERALLTVLLLRGAQSPGQLKSRTERLHAFADRDDVEAALQAMASGDRPLVRRLPRRAGHQDHRWIHLLGPVESEESTAPTAPTIDRNAVLRDGARARDERVLATYDAVAEAYADRFGDELDHKPFDRWLLERVAEAEGPVADVGCGSGHTTAFLAAAGARVTGIDVSPAMIAVARERFPDCRFEVGDLRRLLKPPAAAGWAAITAFHALVHLSGSELTDALHALARTLVPHGWLVLAVHVGNEVRHTEEFLGVLVDIDFVLHDADEVRASVAAAGLEITEWYLRGPVAGEVETDRLYVVAVKPGQGGNSGEPGPVR